MNRDIHWRGAWGLWWPSYDASPERTYAYIQKHLADMDMTVDAVRGEQNRVCIQAGGHVGIWPLRLSAHFSQVLTFEPDPALFACLSRNIKVSTETGIECYQMALGERAGVTKMATSPKAGSWAIDERRGTVSVEVTTIDQVMRERALPHCSAIILDIEGHEVQALKGARATIEAHMPVIHLEELKPRRAETREYMRSIGYVERARAGHDALYVHERSIKRGGVC